MRIASLPRPNETLANAPNGAASRDYLVYFQDVSERLNTFLLGDAVRLPVYTVAKLPAAKNVQGGLIYVSDESGGAVPAFSDGVAWRRMTDRQVVS